MKTLFHMATTEVGMIVNSHKKIEILKDPPKSVTLSVAAVQEQTQSRRQSRRQLLHATQCNNCTWNHRLHSIKQFKRSDAGPDDLQLCFYITAIHSTSCRQSMLAKSDVRALLLHIHVQRHCIRVNIALICLLAYLLLLEKNPLPEVIA